MNESIYRFCSICKEKFFVDIKCVIIDGTFNSAPKNFLQMITIHGKIIGKSYPILYILMSNKSEIAYRNVFQYMKQNFLSNFQVSVSDFKSGLHNAFSTIDSNSMGF